MNKLEKRVMELEAEVKELRRQLLDLATRGNTTFIYNPQPSPLYIPPVAIPIAPSIPYYPNPIITCTGVMDTQTNTLIC